MTDRIQLLDDLGAEFARVGAEAERTSRTPSASAGRLFRSGPRARTVPIALGIAALLGSSAFAVPATRTAVDGIAGSFAAWVAGDSDDAPGRALEPGDKAPLWFRDRDRGGEARLIAETDGVRLYVRTVYSDNGPWLAFGLGQGLIMGGSVESWRERLGRHAVVVLHHTLVGPRDVLDERGRVPLLGLTTRDVKRLELRYAEGPPLVSKTGDSGFVLMVDAWRPLRELIAYDGTGRVLERSDVSKRNLTYLCDREPVCPPEASG